MCLVFHCLQFAEASKSSKESASADQYTPLPASTDISGNHRGAVVVYTTMAHAICSTDCITHIHAHTSIYTRSGELSATNIFTVGSVWQRYMQLV